MLVSVLVMPAVNNPVSDIGPRLRATHWLWTGEMHTPSPAVVTDPTAWRWPAGVPGRDGVLHPWFGIGQSLLMLPADVVATAAGMLVPQLKSERGRTLVVSYVTFPLFHGLGVAVAFLVLLALGVPRAEATLGAILLLVATTYLWHVQNIQENTQQFLFTAAGCWAVLQWSRTREPRWLTIAAACVGFNLLIRVTTMADVVGVGLFALMLGWTRPGSLKAIVIRFAPVVFGYVVIDRLYHWVRFGTITDTYMARLGEQMRLLNPQMSPLHPFEGSFADGFLGVFLSPAKSVFIYDPLLVLTLGLVIWHWRKLPFEWRAYVVAMSAILVMTAAGYATYYNWEGEASWGNRFTTTPVFGLALLAVPLALRSGASRALVIGVVAVACAVQLVSLVFPSWGELVQNGASKERFALLPGCQPSTDYFVLGQRVQNLWLWITTGVTGPTCDGQPTGTPLALWGLLPFNSLSPELRLLARAVWLAGWAGVIVWARRIRNGLQ